MDTQHLSVGSSQASGAILQSDGKIVVAGTVSGFDSSFMVPPGPEAGPMPPPMRAEADRLIRSVK